MAKCVDHLCKLRGGCYRYLAKIPTVDSFFGQSPRRGNECPSFDDAHDWSDTALHTLKDADARALRMQQQLTKPYYKEVG